MPLEKVEHFYKISKELNNMQEKCYYCAKHSPSIYTKTAVTNAICY